MPQVQSDESRATIAQKLVNWKFRDGDLSFSFAEWAKLYFATVIKSNRQFSQELFDALSEKISISYKDPNLSDVKKEVILYFALSYLAHADPQANQVIHIKKIAYTVETIQLTSGWLSAPYYAYGLRALSQPNAPSYLIFQGSTNPSNNGFLAGLLADTRPHGAIGAQLYARGQEKIQKWINKEYQQTKKRVICTGASLGGAMSLHAHIHQPNKVDFFVANPPSLTNREQRIYEEQLRGQCRESDDPRMLKVASHINDPVWSLGSCYFPHGTEVYRYGDNDEYKLVAHARSAVCSADSPEPQFVTHKGEPVRNYYWKSVKPVLFFGVLLLHALAWIPRVVIQIIHEIGTLFANCSPSSAAQEGLGSPHNVEQGMASSYSSRKRFRAPGEENDLGLGKEPVHNPPFFSRKSVETDNSAIALDADSNEREHRI